MIRPSGDFALKLRTLRETHGLSVRALAEFVGVSKVTIWKWERGDNEPRDRHLLPLARALNVSPDELRATIPGEPAENPLSAPPAKVSPASGPYTDLKANDQAKDLADVVARAKQMIADASGVGPKNISITIEY